MGVILPLLLYNPILSDRVVSKVISSTFSSLKLPFFIFGKEKAVLLVNKSKTSHIIFFFIDLLYNLLYYISKPIHQTHHPVFYQFIRLNPIYWIKSNFLNILSCRGGVNILIIKRLHRLPSWHIFCVYINNNIIADGWFKERIKGIKEKLYYKNTFHPPTKGGAEREKKSIKI